MDDLTFFKTFIDLICICIITIVVLTIRENQIRKSILEISKKDENQLEKVKVTISKRPQKLFKVNKDRDKYMLIALSITFIIVVVVIRIIQLSYMNDFILKMIRYFAIALILLLVLLNQIFSTETDNQIEECRNKLLKDEYFYIEQNELIPSTDIDYNNIKVIQKCLYAYTINKCHCHFIAYKLYKKNNFRREKESDAIANIREYIYDLDKIKIKPYHKNNIINSVDKINKELSKTKVIDKVLVRNHYIVIRKETVLNDYAKEDFIIDMKDIKNFYEKILEYK